MKAGLPWIDGPTDLAIKSVLYKIAKREKISYILNGHDFRTEGMQPNEWTYSDSKQLQFIHKKFGNRQLKTYPLISFYKRAWLSYVRGIKLISPFYFVEYSKKLARDFLEKEYNWKYYGGHHHENIFTKFAIAYWLPKKFNIDKRIITLSAQVMSNEITREKAISIISNPPEDEKILNDVKDYTIKKLELTFDEFERIWNQPNKSYVDYPSEHERLMRIAKFIKPYLKYFVSQTPSYFIQIEERENKN
jgi:hypothetical protein